LSPTWSDASKSIMNMEGDQEKIGEGEVHGGAVSVVEENVSINEEEIMGGLTDNEKQKRRIETANMCDQASCLTL